MPIYSHRESLLTGRPLRLGPVKQKKTKNKPPALAAIFGADHFRCCLLLHRRPFLFFSFFDAAEVRSRVGPDCYRHLVHVRTFTDNKLGHFFFVARAPATVSRTCIGSSFFLFQSLCVTEHGLRKVNTELDVTIVQLTFSGTRREFSRLAQFQSLLFGSRFLLLLLLLFFPGLRKFLECRNGFSASPGCHSGRFLEWKYIFLVCFRGFTVFFFTVFKVSIRLLNRWYF